MPSVDYDVAIIGAGPAGTACALALHGKGLKVALIEEDVFPRDKFCGDAIPGAAIKAMNHISAEWTHRMKSFAAKTDITSISIFLSQTKAFSYTWKLPSFNSKRIDFDNFLFQLVKKETGTFVLEKKRLQKIVRHDDCCECFFSDNTSLKTSMVVGCDGAYSVVKRQLSKDDGKTDVAAIRAYYKGIEGIRKGYNEIHILKEIDGYFWVFPLEDGWANVGFGIFKNSNKNSITNIRKTLEGVTQSERFSGRFKNATLEGKVQGFALPIWTRRKNISGERFILCGDAASLVDPLQGHGIDKAMWSGVIAAEQIGNCFGANNFSEEFIKKYEERLHEKVGEELSRNYTMMRLFVNSPWLVSIISHIPIPQPIIDWTIRKMKI